MPSRSWTRRRSSDHGSETTSQALASGLLARDLSTTGTIRRSHGRRLRRLPCRGSCSRCEAIAWSGRSVWSGLAVQHSRIFEHCHRELIEPVVDAGDATRSRPESAWTAKSDIVGCPRTSVVAKLSHGHSKWLHVNMRSMLEASRPALKNERSHVPPRCRSSIGVRLRIHVCARLQAVNGPRRVSAANGIVARHENRRR